MSRKNELPKIKVAANGDQNSDTNTSTETEVPKRKEIRLRRCPSTSKVETIVTEDEKLRRAQPDKP